MAKHVILEAYSFNNATRTVTITGKNIRREQLLLITDVTANTVIYNFSDPSLGFTSYTNAVDPTTGQETTTIVLAYNTTALSSSDKLAIMTEETYQEIMPAEVMRDPVDKMRVSTPQALIDTDFEYGTQPTKWEGLNLLNNRPSAFMDVTAPLANLTNITASGKVVTVTTTTPPTAGTPFFLIGTLDGANVDGWWIVETVSAGVSFTFTTINTPAASLYDANKTYLYSGTFYTGSAIPAGTGAIVLSGAAATVTTTNDHGLRVGDNIYITGTTGATGTLNSTWVVATTPTNTTFTFACTATGTITAVANASIYPRSTGFIQHRAFDGGVQFSNLAPYHGYQVIRQTRRQFRYQSGKGVQFSTGSIMKPTLAIDTMTSSGTTVTVATKYAHGLLPGASIVVSGCNETAYNGTFTVATAPTALTLTYTAGSAPSATPASGNPGVSPSSWYGSTNRVGMFDHQNGFYFEFDGQTLYCVKRSSTSQISGVVAVNTGSQSVVGTNTKFSQQLKPGDMIVIRGQSYQVQQITSDTQMYIYPEYRGTTNIVNSVVSKTVNTRYPQSSWNIDKMDGTGHSLMTLDLTKMQMFYCDYTWYGAGAIRFGFKNNRGEVVYCHRIPNNNVNTEAYMRSGNLVARYETSTIPYNTYLTATLSSAATTGATISVGDTTGWPASGTVVLTSAAATGAVIEYITYSAKTLTSLTITARAQTGGQASAQTFTVTGVSAGSLGGTAPIKVELYSPQAASTISHWGSSVIMDGRYDDDKSLVFNAGSLTSLNNLAQNARQPILSIRIAPSVDNGSTGLIGAREIINRMQLTLRQMDVYTSGTAFKIEIFLNGRLSGGAFASVGGSSLAQVAYHTSGQTIAGGEAIFGFFTSNSGAVTQDLSIVRDIGNSILGGGNSLNVPTTTANLYPDGPDVLTVCCTNITAISTSTINSRLSWTEAQA
jgi:hypothetical protein